MATVEIPLTQGKVALIDEADLPLVEPYTWCASKQHGTHYALTRIPGGGGMTSMHRLVSGAGPGDFVDHINGDGTDNRRSNLRKCTHQENTRNRHVSWGSSKYRGVHLRKAKSLSPWRACITAEKGKPVALGSYASEDDAARAYNAAAVHFFREFANINKIEGLSYEESVTPPVPDPWVSRRRGFRADREDRVS